MILHLYNNRIGEYTLEETNDRLTHLWFGAPQLTTNNEQTVTPLLREAQSQIEAYFDKRLKEFSLPLDPTGTPFQIKIWQLLKEIPYGETRTYGEIATKAGNPKSSRAVGMANHHNPLPIFIPCHRVIGANGTLTGYAGGVDIKQALLNIETT